MAKFVSLVCLPIFLSCICVSLSQSTPPEQPTSTVSSSTRTVTSPTTTTTTEAPKTCDSFSNKTCDECLQLSNCFYCQKDKKCFDNILSEYKDCGSIADVNYKSCKLSLQVMIILVSTAAGIVLLGLIVCCCCCCRKHKKWVWSKDQAKWEQQREELKMRSDERKKERQSRTDQIRRKYGLMKDDSNYQRFDA